MAVSGVSTLIYRPTRYTPHTILLRLLPLLSPPTSTLPSHLLTRQRKASFTHLLPCSTQGELPIGYPYPSFRVYTPARHRQPRPQSRPSLPTSSSPHVFILIYCLQLKVSEKIIPESSGSKLPLSKTLASFTLRESSYYPVQKALFRCTTL